MFLLLYAWWHFLLQHVPSSCKMQLSSDSQKIVAFKSHFINENDHSCLWVAKSFFWLLLDRLWNKKLMTTSLVWISLPICVSYREINGKQVSSKLPFCILSHHTKTLWNVQMKPHFTRHILNPICTLPFKNDCCFLCVSTLPLCSLCHVLRHSLLSLIMQPNCPALLCLWQILIILSCIQWPRRVNKSFTSVSLVWWLLLCILSLWETSFE